MFVAGFQKKLRKIWIPAFAGMSAPKVLAQGCNKKRRAHLLTLGKSGPLLALDLIFSNLSLLALLTAPIDETQPAVAMLPGL
jgi:hypothetical protein